MRLLILATIVLAGTAWGQATAPKPVAASADAQNRILKAEHSKDQAEVRKQADESKFLQLQKDYADADGQSKLADREVAAAIEAAWQDSKLSKDEYTFDPADFIFQPKPKAAAPVVKK